MLADILIIYLKYSCLSASLSINITIRTHKLKVAKEVITSTKFNLPGKLVSSDNGAVAGNNAADSDGVDIGDSGDDGAIDDEDDDDDNAGNGKDGDDGNSASVYQDYIKKKSSLF